ncbi:MAG: hypothetical protein MZV65_53535 [Chromatiales bacterium]|nr:hypothetical protein [Chromatiales bacterium]
MLPSIENVINGTYQPLSRPLFIYVQRHVGRRAPRSASSCEFMMKQGAKLVERSRATCRCRRAPTTSAWKHFDNEQARHRVRRPQPGRRHDRAAAGAGSQALIRLEPVLKARGRGRDLAASARAGRNRAHDVRASLERS